MQYRAAHSRGFSLVELMVALTLFMAVVTMAIGTLLVLINANAKAQNMQDVMTNLTFALDSMTREIRTGTGYYCAGNLPSSISDEATQDCITQTGISIVEGGSSLTGSGSPRIAYRFANGRIERRLGSGSWLPLTSDIVEIETMYFTVLGSDTYSATGNTTQPTVTIFISGRAGDRTDRDAEFSLQTTITRRLMDI